MTDNYVITERTILLDIDASNKHEVFEIMSDNLYKLKRISSKEKFIECLYERESQGETGVELGLAIPHGKSKTVIVNTLSMCRLNKPIQWETLDDSLVNIIVMFAISEGENANDEHLDLLAKVAGNLSDIEILDFLKISNNKSDIIKKLLL